jgi:hypothetical protein
LHTKIGVRKSNEGAVGMSSNEKQGGRMSCLDRDRNLYRKCLTSLKLFSSVKFCRGVTNFSVCSAVESRDGVGWLEVPGAGLAHLGRDTVSTQWNQCLNPRHCLSLTICGEQSILSWTR